MEVIKVPKKSRFYMQKFLFRNFHKDLFFLKFECAMLKSHDTTCLFQANFVSLCSAIVRNLETFLK